MTQPKNKLYIIVGHYGSGKSEFAINFAKKLNTESDNVCIADLDIVNPYFRSREERKQLIDLGINVVSDTLNSTKGLDMPYLSPAIRGQVIQTNNQLILDCGGDHVGIRVLKQFYKEIKNRDFEMLMVINVFRPETSTVDQIINMKQKLEAEINLKITGYIHNSNFLRQTTREDIVAADMIVKEVSKKTNIPIVYISGIKHLINQLPEEVSGERMILDMSLRNDWM